MISPDLALCVTSGSQEDGVSNSDDVIGSSTFIAETLKKRFLASDSSVSDPRGQQCLPPLTRQACRLLAMTGAAQRASGAGDLSSLNGGQSDR
ncbi:hypothetical protein RRG08_038421 [Elysia crispata]|uniref:Uncharacterized protein n=1 Tax=Elysia crispata TaxID=231223 RepID=A0AAE1ALZ3_9GAST|nr:hypothetical protein RRG08_038421 [Elysia crispata]